MLELGYTCCHYFVSYYRRLLAFKSRDLVDAVTAGRPGCGQKSYRGVPSGACAVHTDSRRLWTGVLVCGLRDDLVMIYVLCRKGS